MSAAVVGSRSHDQTHGHPRTGDTGIERALLSNGRPVDLRRATPYDYAAVRAFYEHLDDESTYFRFFGIRRRIPEAELRDVVGAGDRHVTMLATIAGVLIGIGEYIVAADLTEAEVAFAVADDHHREGIATLLLERLAVIGHEHGLRRFTAMVLPDNADMQLVFRTVGLPTSKHIEDGTAYVTLELTSLDSLFDAAAGRSAGTPPPQGRASAGVPGP